MMSKAANRAWSIFICIALIFTIAAAAGTREVSAAGTVVPSGTTNYDFSKITEKTLSPGTEGFEGFSGTFSDIKNAEGYVQFRKTSTDALTFVVESTWTATFSSTRSNNARGLLITGPLGENQKLYGCKSSESLTLSNMAPGTYTITGTAVDTEVIDGNGNTVTVGDNHGYLSAIHFEVEASEPPADVTGLTAEVGNGQVTLKWTEVQGAASYEVYVDNEAEPTVTDIASCTIGGLQNDVEHSFRVVAVNTAGKSAGVTVTATPKEPTDPPGAFTLAAVGGNGRVNLSWSAAQYAESYDVSRDGTVIAAGLSDTAYEDSGLINGTDYTYVVTAKNKNGNTLSNTVRVSPVEPLPSDVKIVEQTGWLESALVRWTNPAEVEKYNVYVKQLGEAEYIKVDDGLLRYYGDYYRVDIPGLAAGQYIVKIASVTEGVESSAVETEVINVLAHDRSGYAHDPASPNGTASGGYNDDGTPKEDAQILYVDKDTVNTIELDVITNNKGQTTHCTGLANIMQARQKGYDKTPLIIRVVGMIDGSAVDGLDSKNYLNIKGCYNVTFEGIGSDTMLNGWALLVRSANNVEIRNLAVKAFNDDGISLDTDNTNIWVHNVDFFYGQNKGGDQAKGDGSLDVKSHSTYVTFSYNHFWDSGKSSLCGMHQDSGTGEFFVTYHHNWFDHSDSRHPRIRVGTIHIYNNYYDGNAKYGVGVTTGSSAFVENNYFRNCKNPMLSSLQGTDALGEGTFSGEDGGMIKAFGNVIVGDKTEPVIYASSSNLSDFDAYLAQSRDEAVPSNYVTKVGGTTYNNFDTAANMYSYKADSAESVPEIVSTYAGRVQGGDFNYEFDDSSADTYYGIDTVLEAELGAYVSPVNKTYLSPGQTYPATEGDVPVITPAPSPTATPAPSYDYSIVSAERAGNSISAVVEYSGTAAPGAYLIAAVYNSQGVLIGFNAAEINGSGTYVINDVSASSGQRTELFIWSNLSEIAPLSKNYPVE